MGSRVLDLAPLAGCSDAPAMGSSYTQLYVHLVWTTRSRASWIDRAIAPRLHGLLSTRCSLAKCVAVAVGSVADHVHVLVKLHPSVAVADLARDLKATSSAFMRQHGGRASFEWQEGYGAFALRSTDVEVVRDYVLRQEQHHAKHDAVAAWEPGPWPQTSSSGHTRSAREPLPRHARADVPCEVVSEASAEIPRFTSE